MKKQVILSALLLGASAMALSTEAAATTYVYTDPVTGLVQGTGNVLSGIADGGWMLVDGVAEGTGTALGGAASGTKYLVNGVSTPVYYYNGHRLRERVYVVKAYRNNRLVSVSKTVVYKR